MADQKISELTAMTTPIDADLTPMVDVTAVETKKITWASLKAAYKSYFDGLYAATGLGVTGDLMLADFSAYVIKDGSGPFVAMSDQVHFLKNKTVIKAFWNVDGSPWLTEPIVPSTSNSTALASPFVVLSSQV
jgi:hypothetical protein